MIWLPDSDITNYLLKLREPAWSNYVNAVSNQDTLVLSPVVHYEVTRYAKLRSSSKVLESYGKLVRQWLPVQLAADDWEMAASLWADRHLAGKPIEDADLLIAVSALKSGATLVTNNTRHYDGLGLELANWTR